MKKNILVLVAVLVFGASNAQEVKFGVKGGMNVSDFIGKTDGADFKSRVGFNVGGFIAIKFSEQFTLQPEVLFSEQGAKLDNLEDVIVNLYEDGNAKFKLSYINIPIMFKCYIDEKFNLEFGPQIGFLTSAKIAVKLNDYNQTVSKDAKDFFESIDLGLNVGAGYDFTYFRWSKI
jgi:hypothetical protein